jgi:pimeloyl-ACP methyl ester carboxylesterase
VIQPAITRPFYFGEGERLFGVLDLPAHDPGGRAGVLVCSPVGHESIWCHRALRQLAARLAAAGHPVLRFDYDGCGDSLGEMDAVDLERWIADVRTALAYLRARFAEPCVLGLRLGATLALLAHRNGARIERLVLWQPVVSGATYLRELRDLHAEHARQSSAHEVLGFAFSEVVQAALAGLDLCTADGAPPRRLLQLVNVDGADQRALHERLARAGDDVSAEWRLVPEPSPWLLEPFKMSMPAQSLDTAAAWIRGGAP